MLSYPDCNIITIIAETVLRDELRWDPESSVCVHGFITCLVCLHVCVNHFQLLPSKA